MQRNVRKRGPTILFFLQLAISLNWPREINNKSNIRFIDVSNLDSLTSQSVFVFMHNLPFIDQVYSIIVTCSERLTNSNIYSIFIFYLTFFCYLSNILQPIKWILLIYIIKNIFLLKLTKKKILIHYLI